MPVLVPGGKRLPARLGPMYRGLTSADIPKILDLKPDLVLTSRARLLPLGNLTRVNLCGAEFAKRVERVPQTSLSLRLLLIIALGAWRLSKYRPP